MACRQRGHIRMGGVQVKQRPERQRQEAHRKRLERGRIAHKDNSRNYHTAVQKSGRRVMVYDTAKVHFHAGLMTLSNGWFGPR